MGKREAIRKFLVFFIAMQLFASLFSFILAAQPLGMQDIAPSSSTRYEQAPDAVDTQAGNVTEIDIAGVSNTQTWAGFFGNITAEIILADSSGYLMYDWNDTNPTGQIYAADDSVNWNLVQCFNYTATGDGSGDFVEEVGGDYSLYGKNLDQLEAEFGISIADLDGINETFSEANQHDAFTANGYSFAATECPTTYVYDNTGAGVQGNFEEVLLWDPILNNTIFTTLLEENKGGYDNMYHDFEMLVLEDGHGVSATSTTSYNFYLEIA
jgi:hypothetical protein